MIADDLSIAGIIKRGIVRRDDIPVIYAKRYGVSAANPDNYAAAMRAVAALGGAPGVIQLPAGELNFLSASGTLPILAGLRWAGQGRGRTRLATDGDKLFANQDTANISDAGIADVSISTTSETVDSNDALIYIDGPNVDGFSVLDCEFDCAEAFIDAVFVKTSAGKSVKDIVISRNRIVRCDRIGFEVINHTEDNEEYVCESVFIDDNEVEDAETGISISGRISGGSASRNRVRGSAATAVGVEVVGARGIAVDGNIFSGTFSKLIQTSNPNSWEAEGLTILGNRTAGRVTGDVELAWAGSPSIDGNNLMLVGSLILSGAGTHHAILGPTNHIDSTGSNALIFDNSPSNRAFGGIYSTKNSTDNHAVIRAINSGATNIVMIGPTIRKGTGGTTWDQQSGGQLKLSDVYGLDNNENAPGIWPISVLRMQGLRTSVGLRGYTNGSGQSTVRVTFPPDGNWLPQAIQVTGALCKADGSATGYFTRQIAVRASEGGATQVINNTAVVVDSGCAITTATPDNNMLNIICTAAGDAPDVFVAWSIEVSGVSIYHAPQIVALN